MAAASNYTYATIFEGILLYASEAPTYHIILEVLLVLWIVKLLFFTQQYHPDTSDTPTQQEENDLINEWQPEPLVPPFDDDIEKPKVVSGIAGTHVTVNGQDCLNLATYNFLGLLSKCKIHDVAANTIRKYGVGSCGPRGFYGTMDVHLNLEERIAKFTHYEEAIIYSFGFAAIASAIPAYSKRNDIIFCDEGVSFPIQKGLQASRSHIKYFKHNDMEDLERLLIEQKKIDDKNPKQANKTRRFIVAEAMYLNYGDLVPLIKLVEFRNRYRIPIILEESLSFGVLGKTGRGAVEHFGLSPDDVDIICVSMSMSVASMGGFCAGKSFVIDHQRLSGVGYCFSASVPPFLATAAIEALDIMDSTPDLFSKVRENAVLLHKLLREIPGIDVGGYNECPVVHVYLSESKGSREADQRVLNEIVNDSFEKGLAIVTAKYLEESEHKLPQPSIRLAISSDHTEKDIHEAIAILKSIIEKHV